MKAHFLVIPLMLALGLTTACGRRNDTQPPVATPGLSLNHPRAPLGSPIELKYRFTVAPGARFDRNYRVMVHFLDADEELMWTDDHDPVVPTSQWKPGQVIEYTRTVFLPVYPYVGEAAIAMGLYSTADKKRLTLSGQDLGQRAYKVATIQLLPQTENVFLIFKDGWHPPEAAEDNATVEWQWTKKEATLSFRNPRRPAVLYLDFDGQPGMFQTPQAVTVQAGGQTVDSFVLASKNEQIRKIPLRPDQMGTGDMVEVKIAVDKTFVPALVTVSSRDARELGIRVFHAFVEPK